MSDTPQHPPRRAVLIEQARYDIASARALRLSPSRPYVVRDRRHRPYRASPGNSVAMWLNSAARRRVRAAECEA